jgi:hypothetical protein
MSGTAPAGFPCKGKPQPSAHPRRSRARARGGPTANRTQLLGFGVQDPPRGQPIRAAYGSRARLIGVTSRPRHPSRHAALSLESESNAHARFRKSCCRSAAREARGETSFDLVEDAFTERRERPLPHVTMVWAAGIEPAGSRSQAERHTLYHRPDVVPRARVERASLPLQGSAVTGSAVEGCCGDPCGFRSRLAGLKDR